MSYSVRSMTFFVVPHRGRHTTPCLRRDYCFRIALLPQSFLFLLSESFWMSGQSSVLPDFQLSFLISFFPCAVFKVRSLLALRQPWKPSSLLKGFHRSQSFFFLLSGSHLLSHTVSSAVPSAGRVLTFVFGMGTGVPHGRIATRYPLSPAPAENPTARQTLLPPAPSGALP